MEFKNVLTSVVVAACCLGSFVSCSDDDDNKQIYFSAYSVQVAPQDTVKVLMAGGTQPYTATSSDNTIAEVKTDKDTLFVMGVKDGKISVMVKDKDQLTNSISVNVTKPITFDKGTVEMETGKEEVVTITNGTAPYTVYIQNASVATATIKDNKVTIKSLKAGKTIVRVVDKNQVIGDILVTVK